MENNLQHHGIPGQKWGVRRFQNKDGSLTKAGRAKREEQGDSLNAKRLKKAIEAGNKDVASLRKAGYKEEADAVAKVLEKNKNKLSELQNNEREKQQRKEAAKNRRTLSDADLKKSIERMKLEKEIKDLTDADLSPGKKFINDVLSTSGRRVATTVVTGATLYAIKSGLEGKIDLKEAASYLAPRPKNK